MAAPGVQRDHALEHELLERAKAPDDFAAQVLARLDHTEAKHGNEGWGRPVDELLQEAQEEAADIAGWGVGANYQLTDDQRYRLVVALRLAVASWHELQELREQLAGAA